MGKIPDANVLTGFAVERNFPSSFTKFESILAIQKLFENNIRVVFVTSISSNLLL